MRRLAKFCMLLCITIGLTACSTQPIKQIKQPIPPNISNSRLSMNEIEKSIIRAGSEIGWEMQANTPGIVTATLNINGKQAIVDVLYTKQGYQIQYQSSQGLRYSDGKINPIYNDWIQNLDNAIQNALRSR